jgi:hypothetical protein
MKVDLTMTRIVLAFLFIHCGVQGQEKKDTVFIRDGIGDLNANNVRKGTFPGSIYLPGTSTSVGFGGFIKTISYVDTDKERKADILTPAYFDPSDQDGQFAISPRLSRFLFDARATIPKGMVRGYFEVDFTGDVFKIRHVYASFTQNKHELMAGQYWSAFMDLGALAYIEGTGEPAISGAIFTRQPQIRYTYTMNPAVKLYVSLEDPSSNDALINERFETFTAVPDIVAGVAFNKKGKGHFQLGALHRRVVVDSANQYNLSSSALAISYGAHYTVGKKTNLVSSGSYGKGLGKYLLGINGVAGYMTEQKDLNLLEAYGFLLAIQHRINDKVRCNAGWGTAGYVDPEKSNGKVGFKNSHYLNTNIFFSVAPFVTIGAEYIYGQGNYLGDVKASNHRFQIAIQIF